MKVMRWGTAALVASGVAVSVAAEEQATTETVAPVAVDEELLKQVQSLAQQGLFVETFEEHEVLEGSRWFKSTHEKYASQSVTLDAYTVRTGHLEQDKGLVLDVPAKHYGLAVKLDEPLQIDGSESKKELVVQYELKLQKGLSCGGAYVKLLRQNESGNYADFSNDSPFVIMFGPDKCGANDKVHFIFQHKNPVTGVYEEKHMDSAPQIKSDKTTHLYTLVVRDDNTFEMLIDQTSVSKGSLFEDFTPAVLPSKEIDDLTDIKPSDWVEETLVRDPNVQKPVEWDEDAPALIPDETATKPADWLDDEEAMINDPSVSKPEDWDDEDDGEWVFPQIPNPKCAAVSGCGEWKQPTKKNPAYKGKWAAPFIPNPAYKGEWKARQIPNPDYFTNDHPARLDPIGALAVEVWTMTDGITFDNFWLGNDYKKAEEFANLTFAPKRKLELEEQDKKREDEKRELEERRAKEDSYLLQVQDAAGKLWQYANENPVQGFGSIFVITIATLLLGFFACCGKSQDQDEKEESLVAASTVEKKKEAAKDTAESEDDGKQSVRQRKKAPVVKDD